MVIAVEKLSKITTLYKGAHYPDGKYCVMEAVAYVAGEKWSDKPDCACPVLASFARTMNDSITDDAQRTRLMLPLIPVLVDSKSTREVELKRVALLARWAVRVIAPIALRAARLDAEADNLAALSEDVELAAAGAAAGDAAGGAAWAARAAAEAAAWAAARDATDAAAWAVARGAAGAAVWTLSADILRKAAEIRS